MKKLVILLLMLLPSVMMGQTEVAVPDLSVPSMIAPARFGPNAFPVPDMLDGRTSRDISVELYGDSFLCTMTDALSDDLTFDVFARVRLPLFHHRVNLTLWMPVVEWFRSSPEINALRRTGRDEWTSGWDSGDVYVSTDIMLLEQSRSGLDMTLRAALKTASGNSYGTARVYDSPGYFFDVSAGRELLPEMSGWSLRAAVSTGFLCWQTGNGRQNDAVMFGALIAVARNRLSADMALGGYMGWEGVGDRPVTLKTRVSCSLGRIALTASHQVGLHDWPFHQIRLGISCAFPVSY